VVTFVILGADFGGGNLQVLKYVKSSHLQMLSIYQRGREDNREKCVYSNGTTFITCLQLRIYYLVV
jgi:hypothetical protein